MSAASIHIASTQDEIVATLIALGLSPEAFDEVVHEVATENAMGDINAFDDTDDQDNLLNEAEAIASEMNNSGFPAQVLFLTASLGFEAGREVIERVAKTYLH